MRALYFDCFAGASGDMICGALIDAGADWNELQTQLASLEVSMDLPANACVIIVGITARADWRGPNVLNGRTVSTGTPNEQ